MSDPVTEIQVPDPDVDPKSGEQQSEAESPYKNLLVPLVVVPAVIVMALVMIFVLFGAIAGDEASPQENLQKVMSGGANESEQAAFNLMRQVLEDQKATQSGEESEWGIGADLIPSLTAALDARWPIEEERWAIGGQSAAAIPLSLAATLASLGDQGGVLKLCEFLRLEDSVDPEGTFRFNAAMQLAALGGELGAEQQALVGGRLIELLDSSDQGLRVVAAVALQRYDSSTVQAALQGALGDSSLEVRGCAALSLAEQGSEAGVAVLESMLLIATYEEERRQMPTKWTKAQRISESRQRSLQTLASLDRGPGTAELERLADDDPDARIRDIARTLLARK